MMEVILFSHKSIVDIILITHQSYLYTLINWMHVKVDIELGVPRPIGSYDGKSLMITSKSGISSEIQ